jgi:hypothetical protein
LNLNSHFSVKNLEDTYKNGPRMCLYEISLNISGVKNG